MTTKTFPTSAREILAKLVSFPVFGGDSNLAIAGWIREYLAAHGVVCEVITDETGTKEALHCRIGPAQDGGIILSGHLDVVPVAGQPWVTDPFVLTERDGKLYGRGSCDMKGFVACCLAAVPYFQSAALTKPIYLAFSFDEEIGCRSGALLAKAIRAHYQEQPGGAIIGEPSSLRPIIGHKGIMVHTTTVSGSQGHSSRIRQEVDAVHEAARLIVWLEDKMDALVSSGRLDDRFDPPHTSLHVGEIHGGTAFNIIANECSFTWDLRNIPQDDAEEVFGEFVAHCQARVAQRQPVFANFAINHTPLHPAVPPLDTTATTPIVRLIQDISGHTSAATAAYAAEAGQFSAAGFPAVICGPGDIALAHRANEFVEVAQLAACDALLRRLAGRLSLSLGNGDRDSL